MHVSRAVVARGKPRVYYRAKAKIGHWCVGIGKGFPPMQQCKTWKEAFDYALWWYCNKFIMPLG